MVAVKLRSWERFHNLDSPATRLRYYRVGDNGMRTAKRVAGLITAAWVVGVSVLVFRSEAELKTLPLNSLGDFLADVFAPIAFVWLVVAVWSQSAELREQRAELALTREELGLTREAMKEQRQAMQAQAGEAKKQGEYIETQTKLLQAEERSIPCHSCSRGINAAFGDRDVLRTTAPTGKCR